MGNQNKTYYGNSKLYLYNQKPPSSEIKFELNDEEIQAHYKISQDGIIQFNFKHYQQEYYDVNAQVQSFKSFLKLELPAEVSAIVVKWSQFKKCITDQTRLNAIDTIVNNFSNQYNEFHKSWRTMFKLMKKSSLDIQQYFKKWMSGENQQVGIYDEIKHENDLLVEIQNTKRQFHRYKQSLDIIKQLFDSLEGFNIKDISDYNAMNNYYTKNSDNIRQCFNFENVAQFRGFVNTLNQVQIFFNSKNNLIDMFNTTWEKIIKLYTTILRGCYNENDSYDVINEWKEFVSVIVWHRFIKHLEIKLNEMDKSLSKDWDKVDK